jgi:hypothetical protein
VVGNLIQAIKKHVNGTGTAKYARFMAKQNINPELFYIGREHDAFNDFCDSMKKYYWERATHDEKIALNEVLGRPFAQAVSTVASGVFTAGMSHQQGGKTSLPLIFSLSHTVKEAMAAKTEPKASESAITAAASPGQPATAGQGQEGKKKGQGKNKQKQKSKNTGAPQGSNASQTDQTGETKYPCYFCELRTHKSQKCPQNLAQRRSSAKRRNLCFNCLRPGHSMSQCNSTHCCRTCTKHRHTEGLKLKHHTFICTFEGNPAKDDRPTVEEPSAKQVATAPVATPAGGAVILPTAAGSA